MIVELLMRKRVKHVYLVLFSLHMIECIVSSFFNKRVNCYYFVTS